MNQQQQEIIPELIDISNLTKSQKSAINKKLWAENKTSLGQLGATVKTIQDIESTTGISITDCIADLSLDSNTCERLPKFKASRADILAHKQLMIMDTLSKDKLKASPIKDLALLYDKLSTHERLERGQSTSNINLFAAVIDARAEERLH